MKYINLHLFWWCVGIIILVKWNNTNNAEIAFSYVFQNTYFGEVFQEHMIIKKLKIVVFWQITLTDMRTRPYILCDRQTDLVAASLHQND